MNANATIPAMPSKPAHLATSLSCVFERVSIDSEKSEEFSSIVLILEADCKVGITKVQKRNGKLYQYTNGLEKQPSKRLVEKY